MEETIQNKSTIKSASVTEKKPKNSLKKIDPEATRLLHQLKERANRKSFGRKITEKEIILKGLRLVTSEHLKELQDSSLTEKDRLHLAHEEYAKRNGKITLDQFIGKLIRGELTVTEKP